jgi:hypothetical protein
MFYLLVVGFLRGVPLGVGVMEDDLDADENGDAGTESGMTACEVVRTKWLQSGGAFPLYYQNSHTSKDHRSDLKPYLPLPTAYCLLSTRIICFFSKILVS